MPSALFDLIAQILGPLTDLPFIGDIFVQILTFLEGLVEGGSES